MSTPPFEPASLARLRREYEQIGLHEADVDRDPMHQFQLWFRQALDAGVRDPNAMTLATADAHGAPSARIVLLKDVGADGFTFFTNYGSRKGEDLAANPQAALVFFWPELDRQVRVTGTVTRTTREVSEAYFHSRPRGAQISAWASEQSRTVASRSQLEQRAQRLAAEHPDHVPLPPFWGGYVLRPQAIEFWQGRPDRLHDRLRYTREAAGNWTIARLAP